MRLFKGNIKQKIKLGFGFLLLLISFTFLVNCKSNKAEDFEEKPGVVLSSTNDANTKNKTETNDSLKDLNDVFKLPIVFLLLASLLRIRAVVTHERR